ncbi:MAG: DUF4040 domain-containing protein [Spirochaetes bacterium]|nr:DUF4040 domain-containing protein [Spirochaetota bacterium]
MYLDVNITYIIALLLFVSVFMIVFERRVYRIIVYTCIYSLLISMVYLTLGSPDVAMAEAAIGTYAIIFFIVVAEKYYGKGAKEGLKNRELDAVSKKGRDVLKIICAIIFVGGIGALFISFTPNVEANFYLRDQFLLRASADVGGRNVIGSILMGYRLYDTLFEALLLVIAIMAVNHLSWFDKDYVKRGKTSEVQKDRVAFYSVRVISPILLIFGVYLITNGHLSAGGGFQGGVAVACFFICRYMIHDIYDLSVKKVLKLEELVFIALIFVSALTVFLDTATFIRNFYYEFFYTYQNIHLIAANSLVGIKVACGFFILFYRYIAIERM